MPCIRPTEDIRLCTHEIKLIACSSSHEKLNRPEPSLPKTCNPYPGAPASAASESSELKAKIVLLDGKAVGLNERFKRAKRMKNPSRMGGIEDSFITDRKEEAVRCLTGLSSHASLLVSSDTGMRCYTAVLVSLICCSVGGNGLSYIEPKTSRLDCYC